MLISLRCKKFSVILACCAALLCLAPQARSAETRIQLPAPETSGGMPLMQAMKERHTSREYAKNEVSLRHISNLLWAAAGINRPESGKRTIPLASGAHDIGAYIITPAAVYSYDPVEHALNLLHEGDFRDVAAGPQKFVLDTPLNIVLATEQKNDIAAGVILGHSSQNIYLYCASAGLNAVTRMTMKRAEMNQLLNLPEGRRALLVLTVGNRS